MRYDRDVEFYKVGPEVYDPETGLMANVEILLDEKLCAVYDMSADSRLTLLGRVDIRGIMVHHRGDLIDANSLVLDGVKFWIRSKKHFRLKASYIAEESSDEH